MSKFSIVIPVYNVEKYLDACLESVVSQSFRDFEILLVDDGSPDGAPAMCDAWSEKDSRIQVIHQENGGLSAARNTGIRLAAGEYILFLDSDDWWADDRVLERVAMQLERTPVDVLSFNYRKFYDGRLEPLYFPETLAASQKPQSLKEMLQGRYWVTGACNKAIRRTLFIEHELYFRTGITSEDIDWTLRLALCGETFAFSNVCVFIYRQHARSITHSTTRTKTECLCGNVCECLRLLEEAAPEKAACLRPFVAYQYGTLLHNVANLPVAERSAALMAQVKRMRYLLDCSDNGKVRMIRVCSRLFGFSVTLQLLRLRQILLQKTGKGV